MNVFENPFQMGYVEAEFAFPTGSSPIASTPSNTLSPGDIQVVNNAGELVSQQSSVRALVAEVESVSTTYANVTGLAVAINRVGTLAYEYFLIYRTINASEGMGVQLAYTGTLDSLASQYLTNLWTDGGTQAQLAVANINGPNVAANTVGPGNGNAQILIRGTLQATTLGTLNLQIKAETGGSNYVRLLPGSWARVWAVA